MALVRTFTLPHYEQYPVCVALFQNVKNAAYLRSQLLEANPEFDYAFLDAEMVSTIYMRSSNSNPLIFTSSTHFSERNKTPLYSPPQKKTTSVSCSTSRMRYNDSSMHYLQLPKTNYIITLPLVSLDPLLQAFHTTPSAVYYSIRYPHQATISSPNSPCRSSRPPTS
jgi:hypothetical protein